MHAGSRGVCGRPVTLRTGSWSGRTEMPEQPLDRELDRQGRGLGRPGWWLVLLAILLAAPGVLLLVVGRIGAGGRHRARLARRCPRAGGHRPAPRERGRLVVSTR